MTARVFIEISSATSGGVLAFRDKIQAINPDIQWMYDDGLDILEMQGYQKWPNAQEELYTLFDKHLSYGWHVHVTSE